MASGVSLDRFVNNIQETRFASFLVAFAPFWCYLCPLIDN